MRTVSLSTYIFHVSLYGSDEHLVLDKLPGNIDFCLILTNYLADRSKSIQNDQDRQELVQINKIEQKGRVFSGLMRKGDYGIQNDLINLTTGKVSYTRTEADAEMQPFHFLIASPLQATEGIIALEKFGVFGIKTNFEADLKEYLRKNYPTLRITINSLIPKEILEQYLNRGRVTKIRFIKFGIFDDLADRIHLGHDEREGLTELRVTAKRGESIPVINLIKQVFKQERSASRFIELSKFEYDSVKIELSIENKYRTINLMDPESLRAEYDITNEIEFIGGHPKFESINAKSHSIVNDIIHGIGLGNNDV